MYAHNFFNFKKNLKKIAALKEKSIWHGVHDIKEGNTPTEVEFSKWLLKREWHISFSA